MKGIGSRLGEILTNPPPSLFALPVPSPRRLRPFLASSGVISARPFFPCWCSSSFPLIAVDPRYWLDPLSKQPQTEILSMRSAMIPPISIQNVFPDRPPSTGVSFPVKKPSFFSSHHLRLFLSFPKSGEPPLDGARSSSPFRSARFPLLRAVFSRVDILSFLGERDTPSRSSFVILLSLPPPVHVATSFPPVQHHGPLTKKASAPLVATP